LIHRSFSPVIAPRRVARWSCRSLGSRRLLRGDPEREAKLV
jgi:hypothetical protein